MNKCLHCYEPLIGKINYHEACAFAFFEQTQAPILDYTLEQMASLAKDVIKRSIAVPGVQPKLSLSNIANTIENSDISRLTLVGMLGGEFILKPPSVHYAQMPANESVTMHIASIVGISVVPHSLIKLKGGELCYISKRIDRKMDGNKIHMLDMFQITEAFDKYRSSYEKIGKAVKEYCTNTLLDTLKLWELCIFCYLTSNNDMHLKNFSLIKINNDWHLAPAYDLLNTKLPNPKDTEELALTLDGRKNKLTIELFITWGLSMGLSNKQMQNSLSIYNVQKDNIKQIISKSFLTKQWKEKYFDLLKERIKKLGI
jgi:serine/threonine-protein kinase HipA